MYLCKELKTELNMKPYGVKKDFNVWEDYTTKASARWTEMPVNRAKATAKRVKRTLKKSARRTNKIF